jgi:O-antigen/teichoic acid export membrane protein
MTSTQVQHPSQNLAKSIGRNTVFGVMANFVQMGSRLITVPIVIHHLGLGGYGIWNIIMMTATYMRFGSVGIKTAYQKYVAEATGNGDYERANQLLSTGCAIMLIISVAALIPAALFSHQIARWAGVPSQFLNSAAGSIALLALIMGMSNVGAAFEATVMGGHRIDLVRKFGTVLAVAEAAAILVLMHLGYGLFGMSAVMGASELLYISACYFASHRVVPQIRIGIASLSRGVLHELFRFAGSYQLVNLLEVVYASLVPFAVLRAFGATSAGVYAVAIRAVGCATMLLDAFLPPILSGGTMVFASGSAERMQALLTKAFKVTLSLSLFPLGFIAVFGPTIAYAWTGTTDPLFRGAFWLIAAKAVFASLSLLALVLYRISGKALLDNIRQVLRIGIILATVFFAHKLGFYGVLAGMALSELAGMVFMTFALTNTFHLFRIKALFPDALRVGAAAAIILTAGIIGSHIPLPLDAHGRSSALLKLVEITIACLLVSWPVLMRTGAVTSTEGRALLGSFFPEQGGSIGLIGKVTTKSP